MSKIVVSLITLFVLLQTTGLALGEKVSKKEVFPAEKQAIIDPQTGQDVTGEYLAPKIEALKKSADQVIDQALAEYKKDPQNKIEIYKKGSIKIAEGLSSVSLGPATGMIDTIIKEKQDELGEKMGAEKEESCYLKNCD